MIIVALTSAVAFNANAQSKVEELLKEAEKAVSLADQNPKDARMQLEAAWALVEDSLGDKRDMDRSITYAHKALDIAKAQPELKDTLLGNSCLLLGRLYLAKQDITNGFYYVEMGADAYERELGKYDPATNGMKLACFYYLVGVDPQRAFPYILEAFHNNGKAPDDKKIKNMDMAAMGLGIATEYLLADYNLRFYNVVPLIMFEGERYLVLQISDWHVGMPFVNWLTPQLVRQQKGVNTDPGDIVLLNDRTEKIRRIAPDYKNRVNINFNLRYDARNPHEVLLEDNNSYIINFQPDKYEELVKLYNNFINKKK